METPAELAHLKPFVQRGNELKTHDPVITYYCYYFSIQEAMQLKNRTKESTAYLMHLMDELENLKKTALVGNECVTNDEVGFSYCENFALKVFLKADTEDRAGNASKKTAMSFLAASVFLQMLKVFKSQVDIDEIDEKVRYAKWKAADIAKCLREGRKPAPGPPSTGEDVDATADQLGHTTISSPPAASNEVKPPPSPIKPTPSPISGSTRITPPVSAPLVHNPHERSVLLYDPVQLDQAQKFARFAISALQYEDLTTAVDNLEKSLAILRPMKEQHK